MQMCHSPYSWAQVNINLGDPTVLVTYLATWRGLGMQSAVFQQPKAAALYEVTGHYVVSIVHTATPCTGHCTGNVTLYALL